MHNFCLLLCLIIALSLQQDILYNVEHSLDRGKTWQQRGTIASSGNNQRLLIFTPSNNQQEWDNAVVQQLISNSKQGEHVYTIKLTNQHSHSFVQKVISSVRS